MEDQAYAAPPKDKAIEGVLWYIQSHHMQGGDRLPAERVLCEQIGVSRTALRAAIARLISCGALESRQGSGTYVLPAKPLNIFQETYNFSDAVRSAGRIPSSRLICARCAEAGEGLAQKMSLEVGAEIFELVRVRYVDECPAAIEKAFINRTIAPEIDKCDFSHESLYEVLEREYGVSVAHGYEHISIARMDADEARLLECEEGSPAFFESALEYTSEMVLVEYCKSVVVPTMYRFADNGEANGVASKEGAAWLRM